MMNEFEKRLQYQLESNQEEIDNFNDMVFMSMEQDYQEYDNQDCDEFINTMYQEGYKEKRFNAKNSYNLIKRLNGFIFANV